MACPPWGQSDNGKDSSYKSSDKESRDAENEPRSGSLQWEATGEPQGDVSSPESCGEHWIF